MNHWMAVLDVFLDATTHLYKRSCPCVRRSVGPWAHGSMGPYVPCYFRTTNMAVFEGKKSVTL